LPNPQAISAVAETHFNLQSESPQAEPKSNPNPAGMDQAGPDAFLVTRREERRGAWSKSARELSGCCDSINGRRPPLVFFLLAQAAPRRAAGACLPLVKASWHGSGLRSLSLSLFLN